MPYKDPIKQKEYYEQNKEKEKKRSKERYKKNKEQLKEQSKEYREKNKEQLKEQSKEYREKNKEREKEYQREYYEKRKEQLKDQSKEYREKNKEQLQERRREYCEVLKQHAYDSIISGNIIEQHKWDLWCNQIKNTSKKNHSYSDDFTNDVMFEMMIKGCFYCGELSNTIDRIDSRVGHTLDNCVGCCYGCNISKGAVDPATFVRKAYYRVRGKYYDDDVGVWFVNKQKPRLDKYSERAKKKGVPFELTKTDFDILVKGDCEYCKRSPTTWFGIDRVGPSEGYVLGNVVSCCFDCNVDKLEDDVESMMKRNESIAVRVDAGELVIKECEKSFSRLAK
jgi:hypothetical protein